MRADVATRERVGADRVLKCQVPLIRHGAARLGAVRLRLEQHCLRGRAASLLATHFPQHEIKSAWWVDLFWEICHQVEAAGWFAIDWPVLDYLWEWANVEEADGDYYMVGGLQAMAEFLTCIPVRHYGQTEEDWFNSVPDQYPILAILRALGVADYGFAGVMDWLIEYEIYDNLDVVLGDLHQRADIKALREPLCWLPEVFDYCRQATGNPLLDDCLDMLEWDFGGYVWSEPGDIEAAKRDSQAAQPVWQRIEAFVDYVTKNDAEDKIIELLLGANNEQ